MVREPGGVGPHRFRIGAGLPRHDGPGPSISDRSKGARPGNLTRSSPGPRGYWRGIRPQEESALAGTHPRLSRRRFGGHRRGLPPRAPGRGDRDSRASGDPLLAGHRPPGDRRPSGRGDRQLDPRTRPHLRHSCRWLRRLDGADRRGDRCARFRLRGVVPAARWDRGRTAHRAADLVRRGHGRAGRSDNLLFLYVFWEITSVTSYLLIGNDHADARARAAALQALLVTSAGGLAMLVGFVLLGQASGTYRLSEILTAPPTGAAVTVALILVLVGAMSKSAQIRSNRGCRAPWSRRRP